MAQGELGIAVTVTGLAGALSALRDLGRTLTGNASAAEKFGAVLGASIKLAASAITAAIPASKLMADSIEEIGVQARNLGISAQQFQTLSRAAQLADVPIEKLTTSYKRFQVTLGNIGANKEGLKLLQELDPAIAAAAAAGQDGFTTFIQVSDALDKMTDKARAAHIAQRTLGRSAADVHAIAESYKAAAKEARDFGLTFSDEEIAKAGEYGDKFERIAYIIDIKLKKAFIDALPFIDEMISSFDQLMYRFSNVPSLGKIESITKQIGDLNAELAEMQRTGEGTNFWEIYDAPKVSRIQSQIRALEDQRDSVARELAKAPPEAPAFGGGGGGGQPGGRGVPKGGAVDKHDYWADIRQKAIDADREQAQAMDNQRARIEANLAADIRAANEGLTNFKGNEAQKTAYAAETERAITGMRQQAANELAKIDEEELNKKKASLDQWSDYVSNILQKTESDEAESVRRKAENELDALREKYQQQIELHQLTMEEKQRIDEQYALASKSIMDNLVVDLKTAELHRLRDSSSILDQLQYQWQTTSTDMADVVSSFIDRTVTGFSDMATSSKADFGEMARSIIADIAKMIFEMYALAAAKQIAGLLGSFFGGGAAAGGSFANEAGFLVSTPSAKGNVFSGGNVIPFRRGGVVTKPTIFPMKGGAGLMGEAGPEAVMPLTRGRDGNLGVQSVGGSSGGVTVGSINVTVQSTSNNPKEQGKIIAGAIERQIRELMHKEVQETFRPGNIMNKGKTIGGGTMM